MPEQSAEDMLAELGLDTSPVQRRALTGVEERVIAGFEEIKAFHLEHGRLPQDNCDQEIFERLYAIRLNRLRALEEYKDLLAQYDQDGILAPPQSKTDKEDLEDLSAEELLSELGLDEEDNSFTTLTHVRTTEERRAAEEIARREKCPDFEKFEALFKKVKQDLDTKERTTKRFERDATIEAGHWFIVGGQIAYVAEKGEEFINSSNHKNASLRVVFDNGTQSEMLMRSLERALQKDEAGRRVSDPNAGPLFTNETIDGDEASGFIYVLRSKSEDPDISSDRNLIHKIGVTSNIERRFLNASNDPTFLMADIEVMKTYELFNINSLKLENLLHRIFENAKLELELIDRWGKPYRPQEWYLVPLSEIEDAIKRIMDGTITDYYYDTTQAKLAKYV